MYGFINDCTDKTARKQLALKLQKYKVSKFLLTVKTKLTANSPTINLVIILDLKA